MKEVKRFLLKKYYSHKDFIEIIQHYASFAKTKEHQKDMWAFIDTYLDTKEKVDRIRRYQRILAIKGIDPGMYRDRIIDQLKRIDKKVDDTKRGVIVTTVKGYYHRNYSLAKTFNKKNSKIKTRRDRDTNR